MDQCLVAHPVADTNEAVATRRDRRADPLVHLPVADGRGQQQVPPSVVVPRRVLHDRQRQPQAMQPVTDAHTAGWQVLRQDHGAVRRLQGHPQQVRSIAQHHRIEGRVGVGEVERDAFHDARHRASRRVADHLLVGDAHQHLEEELLQEELVVLLERPRDEHEAVLSGRDRLQRRVRDVVGIRDPHRVDALGEQRTHVGQPGRPGLVPVGEDHRRRHVEPSCQRRVGVRRGRLLQPGRDRREGEGRGRSVRRDLAARLVTCTGGQWAGDGELREAVRRVGEGDQRHAVVVVQVVDQGGGGVAQHVDADPAVAGVLQHAPRLVEHERDCGRGPGDGVADQWDHLGVDHCPARVPCDHGHRARRARTGRAGRVEEPDPELVGRIRSRDRERIGARRVQRERAGRARRHLEGQCVAPVDTEQRGPGGGLPLRHVVERDLRGLEGDRGRITRRDAGQGRHAGGCCLKGRVAREPVAECEVVEHGRRRGAPDHRVAERHGGGGVTRGRSELVLDGGGVVRLPDGPEPVEVAVVQVEQRVERAVPTRHRPAGPHVAAHVDRVALQRPEPLERRLLEGAQHIRHRCQAAAGERPAGVRPVVEAAPGVVPSAEERLPRLDVQVLRVGLCPVPVRQRDAGVEGPQLVLDVEQEPAMPGEELGRPVDAVVEVDLVQLGGGLDDAGAPQVVQPRRQTIEGVRVRCELDEVRAAAHGHESASSSASARRSKWARTAPRSVSAGGRYASRCRTYPPCRT